MNCTLRIVKGCIEHKYIKNTKRNSVSPRSPLKTWVFVIPRKVIILTVNTAWWHLHTLEKWSNSCCFSTCRWFPWVFFLHLCCTVCRSACWFCWTLTFLCWELGRSCCTQFQSNLIWKGQKGRYDTGPRVYDHSGDVHWLILRWNSLSKVRKERKLHDATEIQGIGKVISSSDSESRTLGLQSPLSFPDIGQMPLPIGTCLMDGWFRGFVCCFVLKC